MDKFYLCDLLGGALRDFLETFLATSSDSSMLKSGNRPTRRFANKVLPVPGGPASKTFYAKKPPITRGRPDDGS